MTEQDVRVVYDFSALTFDLLLERMLDRVPATVDKREGSIIYDALAPAAAELLAAYHYLQLVLDETFADTADLEYLARRCAERGIVLREATAAVVQGEFTPTDIDVIGKRFNADGLNYLATELIEPGRCRLVCETAGEAGNIGSGALVPIDYIEGLATAAISGILIPGEDEEDVEALRKRYFASLDSQAFGGNVADYKEKVNALDGVGGCKVYPVWAGGGTVKLVIVDSTFGAPSAALVVAVQSAIDPVGHGGEGLGLAPIGHVVTVAGAVAREVAISTKITYVDGYDFAAAKADIEAAIDAYYAEIGEGWQDEGYSIVRISQIETRLLDLPQILDIQNTTLNGAAVNLALTSEQIPVRGAFDDGN